MSASNVLERMRESNGKKPWEADDESDKATQSPATQAPAAVKQPDTKAQVAELHSQFERLLKAAKDGWLGMVVQKEGEHLTGLLMETEFNTGGMKLVAVGKLFSGAPISVFFGGTKNE